MASNPYTGSQSDVGGKYKDRFKKVDRRNVPDTIPEDASIGSVPNGGRGTQTLPPTQRGHTRLSSRGVAPSLASVRTFRTPSNLSKIPSTLTLQDSHYTWDTASAIVARETFQAPNDPEIRKRLQVLIDYLEECMLPATFRELIKSLMSMRELPYNPYPLLITRVKQAMEVLSLQEKNEDQILQLLDHPIEHAGDIVHPEGVPEIWGLDSIVSAVDPYSLLRYVPVVTNCQPRPETLKAPEPYSVEVLVALVGEAVFGGSLYPDPGVITVRMEYIITGPKVKQGVELFIDNVVSDVHSGQHIPLACITSNDTFLSPFSEEFITSIKETIVQSKFIKILCLLQDAEHPDWLIPGEKQYTLHFIQVTETKKDNEELHTFAEFPLGTLHEGVFFVQRQAESYLRLYTNSRDRPHLKGDEVKTTKWWHRPNRNKKLAERPSLVETDGFKLQPTQDITGPYAWQITLPLKSHWQDKLASLDIEVDLIDAAHMLLLQILMEKDGHEAELFQELAILVQTQAFKLHSLAKHANFIHMLTLTSFEVGNTALIYNLFTEFQLSVHKTFQSTLQMQICQLEVTGKAVKGILGTISEASFSPSFYQETAATLKNVEWHLRTIQMLLVDSRLELSPYIESFVANLKGVFPDTFKRGRVNLRDPGFNFQQCQHGAEIAHINNHSKQYINVKLNRKSETWPKVIATEAVLGKYIADTHVDDVWSNFLMELLTGNCLPRNPYPLILSRLYEASMKMEMHREKDEKLVSRLLHRNAQLQDSDNFIYFIPGGSAHGHQSALALLDTAFFFIIQSIANSLTNTSFVQRKGPFKIGLCQAVTGSSLYYGTVDPYINMVLLDEHAYIKGPRGCTVEAVEIYARIVLDHVLDLLSLSSYPIIGVFLGPIQWTADQIRQEKTGFCSDFTRSCLAKEGIHLKLYVTMDWRYVPVKKCFLLHYLDNDGREDLFPSNSIGLYQNVFATREKAAFHFQQSGPGGDPYKVSNIRAVSLELDENIRSAVDQQDWIRVHRHLLVKSLITQTEGHIPGAWRMMNSIAGQLEYLVTLSRTLLELTKYALQYADSGSTVINQDSMGSIDARILTQLSQVYCYKVVEVLDKNCCPSSHAMNEFIDSKLQKVFALRMTVADLEAVIGVLGMLQNIVAYDVHQGCPQAVSAIFSVMHEAP
ncbi:unnamed protein product [Owenia fusiformis]|uniref:Uncharacterized protein n=1 Tax=Owenia fusiformis TaxID=6347 RepID=A0A8S4PE49_OWEFU|nr:unnamed protein product [Owenia fusiformis]